MYKNAFSHSLVYSFKSKWFVGLVRGESELIGLERSNKFLNLYLIQIFTLFFGHDLSLEAFG